MFLNIAPFTEQSTEYATITNNSQQPVAFKVKTTAPKFYCVRPNAAVVKPGESVQVQVILLGLTKEPTEDFKCRDKFLVITLPAPYDLGEKSVADAWPELETEFKQQAVSKKIKVKYLLEQEQAPAVAQQGHQQVHEVVEDHHEEIPTTAGSSTAPMISPETEQVKKPVEEKKISKPVEEVITSSEPEKISRESTSSSSKTEPVSAQEGSLNSTALILIAIIALVLGWLYY